MSARHALADREKRKRRRDALKMISRFVGTPARRRPSDVTSKPEPKLRPKARKRAAREARESS